jgi:hypothetical protein
MDRRSFGKLLGGTVTAAGITRVSAAEKAAVSTAEEKTALYSRESSFEDISTSGGSDSWELVILDALPPFMTETNGTAAGDIDNDGKTEVIISGRGAILWYRPSTSEKGVVVRGQFAVGIALEDIDGDGRKEIIMGRLSPALSGRDSKRYLDGIHPRR